MLIYTTDIIGGTQASTRNMTCFSRLNECIRSRKIKRKEPLIPFFTDLVNESVSFIPPGIERVFSVFCVCFCREPR